MNKHLFIFLFWYITDIPSDTIFKPVEKCCLWALMIAINVSVAKCLLPIRQFS